MDYEQWKENNIEEYDQCKAILLDYALQDYGPLTKEELEFIEAEILSEETLKLTYMYYQMIPFNNRQETFLENVKFIRSQL